MTPRPAASCATVTVANLAEGLLGRAVIVVEEESVRHWIVRASALLHGKEYDGAKRSAMELHGVAVLTSSTSRGRGTRRRSGSEGCSRIRLPAGSRSTTVTGVERDS